MSHKGYISLSVMELQLGESANKRLPSVVFLSHTAIKDTKFSYIDKSDNIIASFILFNNHII